MVPIDESELISFHAAQALKPYSPSESAAQLKVLFSVWRKPGRLEFNFILHGATPEALSSVVLPNPAAVEKRIRKNELWKTTCLEFFFSAADRENYFEMNLSPSGDWNLYEFDGYRSGMREVSAVEVSLVKTERAAGGDTTIWQGSLRPTASGSSGLASLLDSRGGLVMGAAVVMEYKTGDKDYWALAHAGEKPDFHLRESFRLAL